MPPGSSRPWGAHPCLASEAIHRPHATTPCVSASAPQPPGDECAKECRRKSHGPPPTSKKDRANRFPCPALNVGHDQPRGGGLGGAVEHAGTPAWRVYGLGT